MSWLDDDDYSRHVLRHHPSYGVMLAFQPHRRKLRLRLGLPDVTPREMLEDVWWLATVVVWALVFIIGFGML